ncbi:hypothetical protein NT2_01_05920 [Caenibius tardaugens NBRC 16725]|uniref:Glutamine amidotransferase type-2 domain-containing protein n=1 Tax=Caenibius tardaugens NBRC 16725 TaxID=1219035 RepID=U2ZZ95_9SPHN|nr:class II glutamine amidotransferase [Caenibius tardaugens]GAD47818.1 hypothetical protein NT2_01_05920 [Caenibius tardaugens NBRC 16725]
MCELFAMSSEHPVRLRYALAEFATHGGQRFANRDGWGIVFAQPRDAYLFKEPSAGSTSALEKMVASQPPLSRLVVAHVRRATVGTPSLANTHPFQRRIHGQTHSFAHNGDLAELKVRYAGSPQAGECVGETDSELAFMVLLSQFAKLNDTATLADRFEIFTEFCHEIRPMGDSNVLYAQGETLFIHSDKRQYEYAYGALGPSRSPGLHMRQIPREEMLWEVKGASLKKHSHGSQVLIASVPLDSGEWTGLVEGTTLAFREGYEIMRGTL